MITPEDKKAIEQIVEQVLIKREARNVPQTTLKMLKRKLSDKEVNQRMVDAFKAYGEPILFGDQGAFSLIAAKLAKNPQFREVAETCLGRPLKNGQEPQDVGALISKVASTSQLPGGFKIQHLGKSWLMVSRNKRS